MASKKNDMFIQRYQDLKYNSDYAKDENLTVEEYKKRLEEFAKIQAENDAERRKENAQKLKEIQEIYEKY